MSTEHIYSNDRYRLKTIIFGWSIAIFLLGWLGLSLIIPHEKIVDHSTHHMPSMWGLGIMPFILLLASIAILPLPSATRHWWESNPNRFLIAMSLAGLTVVYEFIFSGNKAVDNLLHHAILDEYIPFIILLFSLYTISGGIRLEGNLPATPVVNTTFLAIGAGIASFIGTTGASMLLIRPLISANLSRKYKVHTIVCFIFLVSNIGGCLLPIGDPPLYLGFLYGVPFFWTMGLAAPWALTCILVLIIYFIWDNKLTKKENINNKNTNNNIPISQWDLRLKGSLNFLFLGGIVTSVAIIAPGKIIPGTEIKSFTYLREFIMVLMVFLSLKLTNKTIRKDNNFNYHAIIEVAAIFAGIFITMQVPLQVLKASGDSIVLQLNEPWHFFWITGVLSSVLDNAPTYVVFFELAKQIPIVENSVILNDTTNTAISEITLIAISLGAVFLGAMTYIGNGPNFMVKAIAEQSGIKMPSFFGYLFKYALPILTPIFLVIVLIFL